MTKNEPKSIATWNIYPEFYRMARSLESDRAISGVSKVCSLDSDDILGQFSVQAGQMNHTFQRERCWDGEAWVRRRPELHVGTLEAGSLRDEFVKITLLGAGGSTSRSIPLHMELDLTPAEAKEFARALLNAAAAIDFRTPKDE